MKKLPAMREYDKDSFYWGLMYKPSGRCKPHIVRLYPRGNDARGEALRINVEWGKQGLGDNHWSIKRFKFYFKGSEIDTYEHIFTREEKKHEK